MSISWFLSVIDLVESNRFVSVLFVLSKPGMCVHLLVSQCEQKCT